MVKRFGKGTMLIPAPREVDEIMKLIPKGKLITINQIREILAKRHKTNTTCPITTGIFARIAAHAAEEDKRNGAKNITPWWRTIREGGILNEKYPGGMENQKRLLESEGHKIVQKGKRYIVTDFEKKTCRYQDSYIAKHKIKLYAKSVCFFHGCAHSCYYASSIDDVYIIYIHNISVTRD